MLRQRGCDEIRHDALQVDAKKLAEGCCPCPEGVSIWRAVTAQHTKISTPPRE
jgi:hypothetical protein